MARQGDWVQLEQSDMRLCLNMAKMAKGGFSHAAIEETQLLIKNPQADALDEMNHRAQFHGHNNVHGAMVRHSAMLHECQSDGCLPWHNGTALNLQTRWMLNGTGTPALDWLRQSTPELTPHPPGIPSLPPADNHEAQDSEIEGVPPGYLYICTALLCSRIGNRDEYTDNRKRDEDFSPDLLTDEGPATGLYTVRCVMMQLTTILKMTAAYCANLTVKMSNHGMQWNFWVYYYLQLADTLKSLLKDLFICIIREQCIDEWESIWRQYKSCLNTSNAILCQIKW